MDVRMFTVGPVAENSYLFRLDGSDRALLVDPGEEAEKLLGAIDELGVTLDGILLTHTHFDHIGAVAPVARATGAEVWVPEIEKMVLSDINAFVPWPGFGPFEDWDAEHTVKGGEKLELAGMEIDVIFTPGHSPGHVTFSIPAEQVVFSGDVLFQQSVGRTDLPGGDWPTLLESIRTLVDTLPPETTVYPGHMGITTLGQERATTAASSQRGPRATWQHRRWPRSGGRPPSSKSWPGGSRGQAASAPRPPRCKGRLPPPSGPDRRDRPRPARKGRLRADRDADLR